VKDGRKTQPRTWGLTMSLTTPMLGSEVAGGVTQTIVVFSESRMREIRLSGCVSRKASVLSGR